MVESKEGESSRAHESYNVTLGWHKPGNSSLKKNLERNKNLHKCLKMSQGSTTIHFLIFLQPLRTSRDIFLQVFLVPEGTMKEVPLLWDYFPIMPQLHL